MCAQLGLAPSGGPNLTRPYDLQASARRGGTHRDAATLGLTDSGPG